MKEDILNEALAQENLTEDKSIIKASKVNIFLAMEMYHQQASAKIFRELGGAEGEIVRLTDKCESLKIQLEINKNRLKEVSRRLLKAADILNP